MRFSCECHILNSSLHFKKEKHLKIVQDERKILSKTKGKITSKRKEKLVQDKRKKTYWSHENEISANMVVTMNLHRSIYVLWRSDFHLTEKPFNLFSAIITMVKGIQLHSNYSKRFYDVRHHVTKIRYELATCCFGWCLISRINDISHEILSHAFDINKLPIIVHGVCVN